LVRKRWGALGLVALALAASAPPAAAHCNTSGNLVIVPKCTIMAALELAVDQANAAADGQVAFVLLKDFRFHPENVTIRNGGTVMFVWADTDSVNFHDPRNSGSTGSPSDDLQKPTPNGLAGSCFWNLNDQGDFLEEAGDFYNVTLRYDAGSGVLSKSAGLTSGSTPVIGDPPLAQAFQDCPAGNSSGGPVEVVVPYHCGIHGTIGNNLGMRATITVVV
jgi:plastocyanin